MTDLAGRPLEWFLEEYGEAAEEAERERRDAAAAAKRARARKRR